MPTIYKGVVTSIGKMNKTCTVTVTYFREARKILRVRPDGVSSGPYR